jgi:hypothetical protein
VVYKDGFRRSRGERKMKKNHLPMLAALGCLVVSTSAQAQDYSYQSIEYPGQTCDSLICIQVFGNNEHGDVVGTAAVVPDVIPFIYDARTGEFTNVTPIEGYDQTVLIDINDRGDVVGSVGGAGTQSGLIVNRDGSSIIFDHPDAVNGTSARGINNPGLVTGFYLPVIDFEQNLFSTNTGFIYDPTDGTFTDIVPSELTIAQGINSRGDVVGSANFGVVYGGGNIEDPCNPGSFFARYGWVRTADGDVTYFRVNGGNTAARAINDAGQIGGFVNGRGFVVELDGTQCQEITIAEEDMILFPGADYTFVQGLSNAGVISGAYGTFDGGTNIERGFVATPQ